MLNWVKKNITGIPGDLYIPGKLLACEIYFPGNSHYHKIFQTRLNENIIVVFETIPCWKLDDLYN